MNFTREPIVETIITPKDGYKLVVRNSKGIAQEEYFVDALEVVSFGHAFFYRCLERPKCFLVPVGDYEVVETRETRMVLKSSPHERGGIKIGGGREGTSKIAKEPLLERAEVEEVAAAAASEEMTTAVTEVAKADGRNVDKKRDRRRGRRRRGKDEGRENGNWPETETAVAESEEATGLLTQELAQDSSPSPEKSPPVFTSLLPPPPLLISETISRYRGNPEYKQAFFSAEEESQTTIDETFFEEPSQEPSFFEEEIKDVRPYEPEEESFPPSFFEDEDSERPQS